ncbi:hypothetical protein ACHAPQ_009118 [Fusarium lateritium]
MDDLIAMASIVQQPHARWLDVISRINSPENVARQQRLKQLDVEIENILKFSRADTQGHVDSGPIKALVREQSRLEEEVERDTKLYEQELQEARAEMNAASLIGLQSTPSDHRNLDIPTPSRSSVNESHRSSHHREDQGLEESPGNTEENNDNYEKDAAEGDNCSPHCDTISESQSQIPNALPVPNIRPSRFNTERQLSTGSENAGRPAKRARHNGSSFTQGRRIEFNAVYQNGTPSQEYRIVQSPRATGYWYVLECTSCSTYFISEDAIQEAKLHLQRRHSYNAHVTVGTVLAEFGTVVLDCNAELAKRNNALLDAGPRLLASNTRSVAGKGQQNREEESPEPDGHEDETPNQEPTQPQASSSTNPKKKKKRGRPKAPVCQWKPPTSFAELDPRIVNLKPGDIVCVWLKKYNHFQPAMIIPWGRFDRFDYKHALAATCLNEIIPKCYDGAQSDDKAPRPWAAGYGNVGDLAHRRMLPGLYFYKSKDFPGQCQSNWLALNKLKIFDKACPYTINKQVVLEYLERHSQYYPRGGDQGHNPRVDYDVEDSSAGVYEDEGGGGGEEGEEIEEGDGGGGDEEDEDRDVKMEWRNGKHTWRMGKAGVRRAHIVRSVER